MKRKHIRISENAVALVDENCPIETIEMLKKLVSKIENSIESYRTENDYPETEHPPIKDIIP